VNDAAECRTRMRAVADPSGTTARSDRRSVRAVHCSTFVPSATQLRTLRRDRRSYNPVRQRLRYAFAALAVVPTMANAHLASSGLGPVYDGVLHLATSPEDLAAVIAFALFVGLRGAEHGRRALLVLPCAWLLGSFAGLVALMPESNAWLSATWLLGLGLLVALDANLPLVATTAIAALLGLMHGFANGSGMNLTVSVSLALLGLATAVFVATALPAAAAVGVGIAWPRIAIRVVGSWIAASGLLLLGWAIRGG